jgi:hypothetical protein
MAVMKINKSGTVVQFIDEDGNIFQQGLGLVRQLLSGNLKYDFLLLTRLPMKASADRFKKSPVWNPLTRRTEESVDIGTLSNLRQSTSDDSFAPVTVSDGEQKRMYADNEVLL